MSDCDRCAELQQNAERLDREKLDLLLSTGKEIEELQQQVEQLTTTLAITSLAVPLEDELSDRIDEMHKYLAMEQGFTLAGIARLLTDCQRRMADDWNTVGRERMARTKAEATVERLTRERNEALKVLAPNMPESGLVDACKQVKQVAISEADNAEQAESALHALQVGGQQIVEQWESREQALRDRRLLDITTSEEYHRLTQRLDELRDCRTALASLLRVLEKED